MALNTFAPFQTKPLEFKLYHGPPTPKSSSQPLKSKNHASAVVNGQSEILNAPFENTQDQAPKSCGNQFEKPILENLIVVEDSQLESDPDKETECLLKSGEIFEMGNRPDSVYTPATDDTIDPEQSDQPNSTQPYPTITNSLLQKSHVNHGSEDGLDTLLCRPMKQSISCVAPKATFPFQPRTDGTNKKAGFSTPRCVSDPSIHVEHNDNDTPHDNISTHKRRRISSTTTVSRKRRNRSYTSTKQRLRNTKLAAGQHKQSRNHSWVLTLGADPNKSDEDTEYEVEKILDSRIDDDGTLQYRVEWVGYPEDHTWYNAGNFKNSPYKISEYHEDDNDRPGPPKMLGWWILCWDEGKNAEDDSNDDKAE